LKTFVIASIVALPLLFNTGEVRAKGAGGVNNIACPAGTCGGSGRPRAKDVKFCKASNCPKGMPK
jgi:hypothetical protein